VRHIFKAINVEPADKFTAADFLPSV